MSHTTTNYGWTIPDESDAPDGASQIDALGNAIDTTLHTVAGTIGATHAPTVFTASGSFPSSSVGNAKYLRISGCNGGAGAGGCPATSAGQSAESGAGAGGASAVRTVLVSSITFPIAVTVGAAGSGGASGANAGATGGQSKCVDAGAVTLWTPGVQSANQKGGAGATSATVGDAAVAGFDGSTSSSTADVVMPGGPSDTPTRVAAGVCVRTKGGASLYGAGGAPGNGTIGTAGQAFGGGGGSSYLGPSAAAAAGAAGAAGIVIIEPVT